MRTLGTIATVWAALAVALALPALASAQDTVPESNSGGSQYLPTVPQGGGDESEKHAQNDAAKKGDEIPAPVVEDLESQSASGSQVAAAAAATAPESEQLDKAKRRAERQEARRQKQRQERREERRAQRRREAREQAAEQQNAAQAGIPTGDNRIGIVFPLLLVSALVLVVARQLIRRRADPAA